MINSGGKGKAVTAFHKAKMEGLDRRISEPLLEAIKTLEVDIEKYLAKIKQEFYEIGTNKSIERINIHNFNRHEISEECLKNSKGYQKIHEIASKLNIAVKIGRTKYQEDYTTVYLELDSLYKDSTHVDVHLHKGKDAKFTTLRQSGTTGLKKDIVLKPIKDL